MGNCLGGEKAHSAGGTEHSSEYGSSHIGTITGRRYSTVRLENLYQMDGLIGRGQSGIISLCHNKRTGAKFACKSLYKKSMRSEGTFDETRREVPPCPPSSGPLHSFLLSSVLPCLPPGACTPSPSRPPALPLTPLLPLLPNLSCPPSPLHFPPPPSCPPCPLHFPPARRVSPRPLQSSLVRSLALASSRCQGASGGAGSHCAHRPK